ncbi:ATP synthase subunit delta [Gemmatirosa kalamazoonensis]|uniref:ATP synthase subunit delta n=1 Tax=Gemmatirosa kalamazoonensis TaxID=861299 RepID=W0RL35_9BACT|nr:ATP synthase F1 subunit delta [Gemmatirosa kalamazoonensis]AHG91481.1 ATP synthase subunit delta [Gemmatirosa kalamazoonensis]
MRDTTIARNYAEVLLALANKADDTDGWGRTVREVADAIGADVTLRHFLESPRVSAERKGEILARAFQDRLPPLFVRFLQTLLRKGRQMLFPEIATEYHTLLDEAEGRVHAQVTFARSPSEGERAAVTQGLSRTLGKQVVPHVTVDPAIVGGVVVRVGDQVMDGSVRRRLRILRERLVHGNA